ncbi:unnamed protein product [Cuscuta campestris]|uniref:Uncharacterized protein n=1 Tax=Cuscuta campestris TaxID=132261 RepID=A0A484K1F4_9ASTE|nr:unnamed protein product [Cuscuta campestris]
MGKLGLSTAGQQSAYVAGVTVTSASLPVLYIACPSFPFSSSPHPQHSLPTKEKNPSGLLQFARRSPPQTKKMNAKALFAVLVVALVALSAVLTASADDFSSPAPAPAPESDAAAFVPAVVASFAALAFGLLF